jgi:hypothetical protein
MNTRILEDALADLIDRYDKQLGMTVEDLIDGAERLAEEYGAPRLVQAVAIIRKEQYEELKIWGIRGYLELAEEKFIEIVRDMVSARTNEAEGEGIVSMDWDFSLINDVIANRRPYPASLIDKVVGAKEHELPVLLMAGYYLDGDKYIYGL